MAEAPKYLPSYELRGVILFGATGSCSLIFSVLSLLFLGSQISSHPSLSTDTISEMMDYAEFFLFVFAAYFSMSVFVWRFQNYFAKFSISWLPIMLFGSVTFSVSFLLRGWLSSISTYQERNPFQSPPPEFLTLTLVMVFWVFICFIVTSIGCGLVSVIMDFEKHDHKLRDDHPKVLGPFHRN